MNETTKNETTKKKRSGCFRTGCLTVAAIIALMVGIIWFTMSSGARLPAHFVLRVPVSGQIDERPADPVALPFSGGRQPLSLEELMTILDRARTDARIQAVLLDIDGLSTSPAKIQELRHSIEVLRRSGKKVSAFLHGPEDKDYQLAVACDSVIVEKGSWLLLDGLKAELFFFAEPLQKLGVSFQASQWKKYKSGIEPLTRRSASPEYLEEAGALLDDAWDDYLGYVSLRRGISREAFASVIDSLAVLTPERARSLKLVDHVATFREIGKGYEEKLGMKSRELFVGGRDYLEATGGMAPKGKGDRIAVINITGTIVSAGGLAGMTDGEGIDDTTLKQALDTAIDDSNVKAIVLRIDSPGGDALAAASMLDMIDDARTKKPIVASMSGVAASGGYMVALGASRIYADPMTITGSIGVFALKPDFSALLQKAGVNREVITRGRYADAYTPFKPFDAEAFKKFDEASGTIYRDFTGMVATHRKMTPARVEAVAGGRVWTGQRAVAAGLVDKIGGLADAVQEARQLAHMDMSGPANLLYLPARKSWVDYLLSGDFSSLASSYSTSLAKGWFSIFVPSGAVLPGTGKARLLLRSDSPQILAIDPVEIHVR
jgi:protease-4